MSEYQAGVCNIGAAETRKRYALGTAGFLAALLLAVGLYTYATDPLALLVVAVPLFVGFEGVLQGYDNFCAGFAMAGVYDVSDTGDERHEIAQEEALLADRQRAIQIHMQSLVGAVLSAAFLYLLALGIPPA